MHKSGRVVVEYTNVRAIEVRIEAKQARVRELDQILARERDPGKIAALESEWVEAHLAIMNWRHVVASKLDAVLKEVLLDNERRVACTDCR